MGGDSARYLIDILALLLATVVVVPLFHAIRLGAILGYLAAGVIVGPWGLAVVTEVEEIRHLGEFGVIFLLFLLGIELKPDKLWQMRQLVLGLGLGQLLLTAGLIYLVAIALGTTHHAAIIIGFGLALSSTAFCLKLLAEKGGLSTQMGQMTFSVLLLQDLAVVPLLALVSLLAGTSDVQTSIISLNTLYSIGVVISLVVVVHYLLNPILERIVSTQDQDVFIALAVLLVLGMAWMMEKIGFSMALGAFLAGIMLADSRYRHQIEADILPFRGILLGLFFMTVGMGIDFALLANHLFVIILLTLGLMLSKTAVMYFLARLAKTPHQVAMQSAVLLSQSGEFGFVLFGFALASGILDPHTGHMLMVVIALTMVLTPFYVKLVNTRLNKKLTETNKLRKEEGAITVFEKAEGHIILAGFGRVGARVGAILNMADKHYIGIDLNQDRVKVAREQGFSVYYGDASNIKVLQAAGAAEAEMIVVAMDDPSQFNNMIPLIRQYYPNLPIYARAKDRAHCAKLTAQGVSLAISETLETSLRLAEVILSNTGLNNEDVDMVIDGFRDDYYSDVVKKVSEHRVVMGELKH